PFFGRVVVLLGEAEIDQCPVPGVAERHRVRFSCVTAVFLRLENYRVMSQGTQGFSLDTATGVRLEGERTGSGVPVVLLHGLTATRRYVLMGSRYLARGGAELIGFDARGHGQSGPAPERSAYEYADMVGDLEAVMAGVGGPAVLVGNSMG